ncbi:MAG: hypothetical protein NXI31_22270 [bacterium]|nr:hypothetical protein [bacterium]
MRKFLAGVAVGAVVVGVIVGLCVSKMLDEKYEHGRRMGELDGRLVAMAAIRAEFGEVPRSPRTTELFSLKTSAAVATVVDGVKTIRVAD